MAKNMDERRFFHQANWLSFKEAKEKLDDSLSSLVLFRCKRHMVLSPRYLGRINKGVKETLDADLRLYCPKLYGVLVAYNNVSVLHVTGDIQDEAPFLHFDIEADFIVFRPTVGCSLKGFVNKVGKDHIGCLIHNCFNASMSKPWSKRGNSSEAYQIAPGVELEFEVTGLSNNNRILSVRASLKPGSLRNLKNKTAAISQDIVNGNVSVDEIQEVLSTPKSKKKRKRIKEHSGVDNPDQGEVNLSDDLFSDSNQKKKRKHTDMLTDNQDNFLSLSATGYEDKESTKNKKRKNTSLDSSSIESMLSSSTPKSNNKRKRNNEHPGADNPAQGEVYLSDDLFEDIKPKKEWEDALTNSQEGFLKLPSSSYERKEGSSSKKKRKTNTSLDRSLMDSMLSTSSIMDSGVDISLVGSDTSVKVKKHKQKERDRDETIDKSEFKLLESSSSPSKKHKHKKKTKIKEEVM